MRRGTLAILVLGVLSGCGYTFGVIRHEGVETIYVPIFNYGALEHRRGIDLDLTQAVVEEMMSRSSLRVVGEEEKADAVLKGRIVDYRERVLLEDTRNNVLESSIVVTLNLELVKKDGTVLVKRDKMLEQASFSVVGGQDEDQARREALGDLAERIVYAMEGPW